MTISDGLGIPNQIFWYSESAKGKLHKTQRLLIRFGNMALAAIWRGDIKGMARRDQRRRNLSCS